ncbi:dihydroorotase [Alkalicoccus halolimnae]|uniref:Dihydroorotase n=1 Tax=Alkalicoccus halolimnae TaxID=1667239 RepID=A0A5C7FJA4_9BACI|nr:dihydroorotase [Alkalicoccus halolimnae]TXF87417.1 dihydroorotase [Alkalicoccus halolimnae]
MKRLFKNAEVYRDGKTEIEDILIDGTTGKVEKIGRSLSDAEAEEYDLTGKLLAPGLVDIHIHLREPGGESKETIETGTQAAARGGFTTVCAMPNTRPVPDSAETIDELQKKIKKNAVVRVLPYAAITERQLGKSVTDMQTLSERGAFAFTDDGVGVQTAGKMYEAMIEASRLNKAVVAHCEDNSLLYGGMLHDGEKARELGIKGILPASEAVHIARDILLAEETGVHYHVCHVSAKESVRVIRDAKRAGINVTAEVTPHHLMLTEDDIPGDDANYKMNPPLRAQADREALIEGLLDGTLDFIATDHAPHTAEEKNMSIEEAPFGIVGLETAFPLLYTHLVETKAVPESQLLDWLTKKPAEVFQLPYGEITEGGYADLVVIDRHKKQRVDTENFLSKGTNMPFNEWELTGWPVMTICEGNIVWNEKEEKVR